MTDGQYRSTLPKQGLDGPNERIRTLLTEAKLKLGMLPNMYTLMGNAPELLETYLFGYERFRQDSGLSPAEQEVVFLTISYQNGCDYCIAAHSVIADTQSKVPRHVTDAIRAGAPISDPQLNALATFTQRMLMTRGRPTEEDVASFISAGYTEKQVLDIILALAVKTISNYTNHIFGTPLDKVFEAREWKPAGAVRE